MNIRQDLRGERRTLRVAYSVAVLASIGNVSRHLMKRLLQKNGVVFLRVGRVLFVPLSEIRRRIPPLWDSLVKLEETLCAARCPQCAAKVESLKTRAVRAHFGSSRARRPKGERRERLVETTAVVTE